MLNLVRLRYRDTPLFLQVGSVVAQFRLEASAGASASLNENVRDTLDAGGEAFDWSRVAGDLFRVHSSPEYPRSAAVRVSYRGYWYFIDDADLESKSTFSLLNGLFSLLAGAPASTSPVLTLPVGG